MFINLVTIRMNGHEAEMMLRVTEFALCEAKDKVARMKSHCLKRPTPSNKLSLEAAISWADRLEKVACTLQDALDSAAEKRMKDMLDDPNSIMSRHHY